MKEIRSSIDNGMAPNEYKDGAYPRGLNKLVDEGYSSLDTYINTWESKVNDYSANIIGKVQNV